MRLLQRIAIVAVLIGCATAFYLPGTGPRNYHDAELVEVQVNAMSSVNTHIPMSYYSLPVCYPLKKLKGDNQNFAEVLLGERKMPSPYEEISVGDDVKCRPVCEPLEVLQAQKEALTKLIKEDYHMHFMMDNLPLAEVNAETGTYSVGVPLGYVDQHGTAFVHNHLHFHIKYSELTPEDQQKHKAKEQRTAGAILEDEDLDGLHRIISFVAHPMSVTFPDAQACTINQTMVSAGPQPADTNTIQWSYSVTWEESDELWSTRWDVYLNMDDHEIHWLSILNSTLTVFVLSAMVVLILMRTLRRDFSQYNTEVDPEDLQEETGWKLVHKDVFRPPAFGWLLAALAGSGAQLFGMTFIVLIIACLGFLAPANRGALFMALLLCFVLLGMYAGYVSARLLKLWGQAKWRYIFVTATLVPGIAFTVFFINNLAVRTQSKTAAVPFGTILAVVAMWFGICVPLVFTGAVMGFRRATITLPVNTNQIPRHIPPHSWHTNPLVTIAIGGVLPFAAVFIEVFFIFGAVWLNRYYYVFGFLFLVMVILTITCAEIAVFICYFQLCAEDYHWWWRSFFTTGSCGVYLFLYASYYFFTSALKMTSFVPILLYFGYMGVLSLIFAVMTGTIGLAACFWFTRFIYGSIKIE